MDRPEEDIPSDPSLDASPSAIPFYLDKDWVEMPGVVWSPEQEYLVMPPREPTPGEIADTHCKRGGLEETTSPVDPILQRLDFTSEYISLEERKKMNLKYIDKLKPPPCTLEDYLRLEDSIDDDAW
tara:strand:+ start:340 stop:717 length:378 start_codon:yes stop_codon:yes gene_type:complete